MLPDRTPSAAKVDKSGVGDRAQCFAPTNAESVPAPEPSAANTELRERFRLVIEAENALAQAIFLCDDLAVKLSRNHPEGDDFVTHYVVPHGLWAGVLREKQNLRWAIQTTLWPSSTEAGEVIVLSGDLRGENALRYLPDPNEGCADAAE